MFIYITQQYFYIFNCDICLNSFCAPHLQQLYAFLPNTYQLGQEYNWIVWKTGTVDPDRLMAIMQTNSAFIDFREIQTWHRQTRSQDMESKLSMRTQFPDGRQRASRQKHQERPQRFQSLYSPSTQQNNKETQRYLHI